MGQGGGGVVLQCFVWSSTYFTNGPYDPPPRRNWTGPITSQGWSKPELLRKPIAICDSPPPPSGSAYVHLRSALKELAEEFQMAEQEEENC